MGIKFPGGRVLLRLRSLRQSRSSGAVLLEESGGIELPAGLTFSVTHDYPEKILVADDVQHRVIGEKGKQTLYSILAMNLNSSDINVAKIVKAKAVDDLLLIPGSTGQLPISKAFDLCLLHLRDIKTNENKETLAYLVAHDIAGHGPISILLEDAANIEEIEINSPNSNIAVYHSKYGRCVTNLRFNGENAFRFVINRLIADAEKELNSNFPIIDAQLSDGSRLHAQLAPYAVKGAAASIRLNSGKGIDLKRLLDDKVLPPLALAYLWLAVETGKNAVVAGAPAAGKTSLLLAINVFIPRNQRVITIEEDINELKFYQNFTHVISLQGSSRSGDVSLKKQVVNALHMRPERLMIGEIRGEEARDVFSGSNLGVPFMTTMHTSSNGQAVLDRLLTRPMSVEQHAISMLDLSLFMLQNANGSRYLESIVEYKWRSRTELEDINDADNELGVKIENIMKNGVFNESSLKTSKIIREFSQKKALSLTSALKEVRKRATFLAAISSEVNEKTSVHEYISNYTGN